MRHFIFSAVIIGLMLLAAYSKANGLEIERIDRVYDGDTAYVTFKNVPSILGENLGIRINGIDTPEIRTRCLAEKQLGYKAKFYLISMLSHAKKVELKNYKRGKYFRLVADLYIDDISASDMMIRAGYAVKYNGGTKVTDWCQIAKERGL